MRAQFWSFDVIFALVIFGTALILISFVWFAISNEFSLAYGFGTENMQAQLQSLQNRLLSAGTPSNWNADLNISSPSTWNNISIGIGTGNGNAVSARKLMTLMAFASYNTITYQSAKTLLGVGYDYFIVLSANNMSIAIGRNPMANKAVTVQVADLPVTIANRSADLHLELWTNTSFGVG